MLDCGTYFKETQFAYDVIAKFQEVSPDQAFRMPDEE